MKLNIYADNEGLRLFYDNGSLQINTKYVYEKDRLNPTGKDLGSYVEDPNLSYSEYDVLENLVYEILGLYNES